MSNTNFDIPETTAGATAVTTAEIFTDPVAYLAGYGIDCEIVPDHAVTPPAMPTAA